MEKRPKIHLSWGPEAKLIRKYAICQNSKNLVENGIIYFPNCFRPIHGLIFLFKWVADHDIDGTVVCDDRSDQIVFIKQVKPNSSFLIPVISMFFFHDNNLKKTKVIENACATQALLSLLLNCERGDVKLGETLENFKSFVSSFDPEVSTCFFSH